MTLLASHPALEDPITQKIHNARPAFSSLLISNPQLSGKKHDIPKVKKKYPDRQPHFSDGPEIRDSAFQIRSAIYGRWRAILPTVRIETNGAERRAARELKLAPSRSRRRSTSFCAGRLCTTPEQFIRLLMASVLPASAAGRQTSSAAA